VPRDVACDGNWLRGEKSTLTAWEKSAEGIVGEVPMSELKPNPEKRGGLTSLKA
jgi:hypothetical protein